MIDFEWRTELTAADEPELQHLLRSAAAYDDEAGFPQLHLDDLMSEGTSHLLVWLRADPRLDDTELALAHVLAAYLRVQPRPGGIGEVSYVVRPEFRSRGITTLLLEKIGLELNVDGGWQGTGVTALRVWARGNHPAAHRVSMRFHHCGISTIALEWRLLMPVRDLPAIDPDAPAVRRAATDAERSAADQLWQEHGGREAIPAGAELFVAGDGAELTGAVWVAPQAGEQTEYGTAGRIYGPVVPPGNQEALRTLLITALQPLRDAGLRVASTVVDSADWPVVHEARLLGFMHDRTDVQYAVGATGDTRSLPLPAEVD
ncbi:hypothetical protein MCHIJ_50720 [Mycolicibacterium chitae]|uniref:Mycothiol synthase n=1 Tax=Mycolicibacterium chitae TaxID=1792 RepID=A0A3S4RFK5_MYCCI|nr:hypothetical protein [Mycolicibacterium chitae]MCV7105084.1 hypothetical protein [Mycolicibacterium chitae]BBZ05635.1 hypothetical protein MCHIJ_50720 [Mycolicibacterium chitae]VEG49247.1 mycothiol synthase [Mycolicibacterium chitae]